MLEILLSNIKLKNKKLTFSLNFPCWGAGKIQLDDSEKQKTNNWCYLEDEFLTKASQLQDDSKW